MSNTAPIVPGSISSTSFNLNATNPKKIKIYQDFYNDPEFYVEMMKESEKGHNEEHFGFIKELYELNEKYKDLEKIKGPAQRALEKDKIVKGLMLLYENYIPLAKQVEGSKEINISVKLREEMAKDFKLFKENKKDLTPQFFEAALKNVLRDMIDPIIDTMNDNIMLKEPRDQYYAFLAGKKRAFEIEFSDNSDALDEIIILIIKQQAILRLTKSYSLEDLQNAKEKLNTTEQRLRLKVEADRNAGEARKVEAKAKERENLKLNKVQKLTGIKSKDTKAASSAQRSNPQKGTANVPGKLQSANQVTASLKPLKYSQVEANKYKAPSSKNPAGGSSTSTVTKQTAAFPSKSPTKVPEKKEIVANSPVEYFLEIFKQAELKAKLKSKNFDISVKGDLARIFSITGYKSIKLDQLGGNAKKLINNDNAIIQLSLNYLLSKDTNKNNQARENVSIFFGALNEDIVKSPDWNSFWKEQEDNLEPAQIDELKNIVLKAYRFAVISKLFERLTTPNLQKSINQGQLIQIQKQLQIINKDYIEPKLRNDKVDNLTENYAVKRRMAVVGEALESQSRALQSASNITNKQMTQSFDAKVQGDNNARRASEKTSTVPMMPRTTTEGVSAKKEKVQPIPQGGKPTITNRTRR